MSPHHVCSFVKVSLHAGSQRCRCCLQWQPRQGCSSPGTPRHCVCSHTEGHVCGRSVQVRHHQGAIAGLATSKSKRKSQDVGFDHHLVSHRCRNAAKIVGLDPAKCKAPNNVHASTAACLSWRYAQLLAAMPKRETETESWQKCAQSLFQGSSEAGEPTGPITSAFGELQNLQGKGSSGAGAFADVVTRRMLPCEGQS